MIPLSSPKYFPFRINIIPEKMIPQSSPLYTFTSFAGNRWAHTMNFFFLKWSLSFRHFYIVIPNNSPYSHIVFWWYRIFRLFNPFSSWFSIPQEKLFTYFSYKNIQIDTIYFAWFPTFTIFFLFLLVFDTIIIAWCHQKNFQKIFCASKTPYFKGCL